MMVMAFPVAMALVGALIYALTEGKASEVGRLIMFAGLMAIALMFSHTVKLP